MAKRLPSLSKQLQITLEGDFFERDIRKSFRANVRDLMDALAKEGERTVRSQIESKAGKMPHYTGHTAGRIRGRTSSLSGKRWQLSAVISADTSGMSAKDAIRTKAAAAQMEGRFHMFRQTAGAMRRSRAVLAANLTRGIE